MQNLIKLFVVLFIVALISCTSDDEKESINKQISAYKEEIRQINKKIQELEEQLAKEGIDEKFAVKVEIEELQPAKFQHYFEAAGTVESVNQAFISAETSGQIDRVLVKEGQYVSRGELLAVLNSDVISRNIDEVNTALELAVTVYNRQKRLWDQNIGSEMQFLEAKNNKENLENRLATLQAQYDMTRITAPINGVVEQLILKEGELANPGMQMMMIVNLNELYINADISENYISDIRMGEMVTLYFPSFSSESFTLPIYRISNVVNPQNRTFRVQLKMDNPGGKIKPNSVAMMKINDYTNPDAITVPGRIVQQDMQGKYVFVAVEKDNQLTAQKKYIKLGKTYQGRAEITSGLEGGDKLIIAGYNKVINGSILRM